MPCISGFSRVGYMSFQTQKPKPSKLSPANLAGYAALLMSVGVLAVGALTPAVAETSASASSSGLTVSAVTTDDDSITLTNSSSSSLDISGYEVSDEKSGDDAYTIPDDTTLDAGASITITQSDDGNGGFEFGIDDDDTIYVFTADGDVLLKYDVEDSSESASSDSSSSSSDSSSASKSGDAQNWPGSQIETAIDSEDTSRSQWSGLDYDSTDNSLWAVENGYGALYHLTGSGESWSTAESWTLHYSDGSGQIDAEGVTVADDGYVYVSSERDESSSDTSEVSRPSILKYDTSSSSSGDLNAVTEWNLAEDFPDIDANKGIEGITWIPDSYLTSAGLIDQNTGDAYNPSDYSDHGNGLFAVSVEATSGVYLYALQDDDTAVQIASIQTDFNTVAELEFDADAGGLWVVSDDSDDGEIATYSISSSGEFEQTALYDRPSDTDNYGNEGFTFASSSTASDGSVETFYADDSNTDGHSLRAGSLELAGLTGSTGTASAGSSATSPDSSGSSSSGSANTTDTSSSSNLLLPLGIVLGAAVLVGAVVVATRRR